jgi:tetratricopeptide (TPR) repeat protein
VPSTQDQLFIAASSSDELITALRACNGDEEVARAFDSALFIQARLDNEVYSAVAAWCHQYYLLSQSVQVALAFWLQRHEIWGLAKDVLHWCLSLKPVYPYMYQQLAICYVELNKPDMAFFYIEMALENNVNNSNFWTFKAKLHREKGEIKEAISCFDKAVTLSPDKPGVVLPYCDLLDQEGDCEKGLELVERLLESNSDNKGAINMKIRLVLAIDVEKGWELYIRHVKAQLSGLSSEQMDMALKELLFHAGSKVAENDLLVRVLAHRKSVQE